MFILRQVCFYCHVLNAKVGYSVVLQILNRNYGDLEYAGIGTTWHDLSGWAWVKLSKLGTPIIGW